MLSISEFYNLSVEDREKIPHDQLDKILNVGVESLIESAIPTQRLKLQSLHARCSTIRRTIKNPLVVASKIFAMMNEEGLFKLNNAFNGK